MRRFYVLFIILAALFLNINSSFASSFEKLFEADIISAEKGGIKAGRNLLKALNNLKGIRYRQTHSE